MPLSKVPLGIRFTQAIVRLGGPELGAGDLDASGRGKGGRGKERAGRGRGDRGGGGRDRGAAGDGRGGRGGRGADGGRGVGKGGRDGGGGGSGSGGRGGRDIVGRGRGGRGVGRGGAWESAGRRPVSRPSEGYICSRCGADVSVIGGWHSRLVRRRDRCLMVAVFGLVPTVAWLRTYFWYSSTVGLC